MCLQRLFNLAVLTAGPPDDLARHTIKTVEMTSPSSFVLWQLVGGYHVGHSGRTNLLNNQLLVD